MCKSMLVHRILLFVFHGNVESSKGLDKIAITLTEEFYVYLRIKWASSEFFK